MGQTLFVPQCQTLSVCDTKSDRCCGMERAWLARLPLGIIFLIIYMCVAVLGRNQTLFCCVFGHVTALQVLKRRSLVKGGARTFCVDVASNYEFTHCV